MANLLIKKVRYSGDRYFFESPDFDSGLNIIEGSNGSGKTTFFMLLYYSFGGNVLEFDKNYGKRHLEITEDTNGFVETHFLIDKISYQIKRTIGGSEIVVASNEDLEILKIHRSSNYKNTFSDWILEKLKIPSTKFTQGTIQFFLNFYDYSRLFYHDQKSDPDSVFKNVDKKNIYTDSAEIKSAIFRIMLGKHSAEYYQKLSELKAAQMNSNSLKAKLDEYNRLSLEHSGNETMNSKHLKEKQSQLNEQIVKLERSREISKKTRTESSFHSNLETLRSEALIIESKVTDSKSLIGTKHRQYLNFLEFRKQAFLELEQLKKIIATHQQFNLFSSSSCPYCLGTLNRKEGHCYCGNLINEEDYERFFYDDKEYIEILKSKKKSLLTIDDAITAINEELQQAKEKSAALERKAENISREIRAISRNITSEIDFSKLNQIDDKILRTKEELNNLAFTLKIQKKLEEIQGNYNNIHSKITSLSNRVKLLEAEINTDMESKISEFNEIFSNLMKNALDDCFDAKIDPVKYTPIINNSEYKEESSKVPIRFNFFLTLFQISINHPSVLLPKLLLIDTPQTSGIDPKNLVKTLSQINSIDNLDSGQVILSTGLDNYPSSFKSNVLIRLEKEKGNYLLKERGLN